MTTVKTWWTTIQREYQGEYRTEFQQESEEEYIAMSSPRTSTDDSGLETGEQRSTKNNSDGAYESHTHEQPTTEESKNENATEDLGTKNAKNAASTEEEKTDSPINESTPTKPPATKKPRKLKAEADTPSEDTPSKKQKTAFSGIKNAPDLDTNIPNTTKPPAKKSRKRKAADDTATDDTPAKRSRKRTAKAADAAASAPKPRKTHNSRKKDDSVTVPPPPPPPVPVSPQVSSKLQQVYDFIQTYPAETFDRDPLFPRTVTLPERNLSGILSAMYWHWQLEVPPEGVQAKVQESIINRFQQRLGTGKVPTDMVTVDITSVSRLEERIQEKILRYGLEGRSLLYVEMKMFDANLEARSGFFRAEVERLLDAVADSADVEAKVEQGDSAEAPSSPLSSPLTIESGDMWLGVCPPPMQKV